MQNIEGIVKICHDSLSFVEIRSVCLNFTHIIEILLGSDRHDMNFAERVFLLTFQILTTKKMQNCTWKIKLLHRKRV